MFYQLRYNKWKFGQQIDLRKHPRWHRLPGNLNINGQTWVGNGPTPWWENVPLMKGMAFKGTINNLVWHWNTYWSFCIRDNELVAFRGSFVLLNSWRDDYQRLSALHNRNISKTHDSAIDQSIQNLSERNIPAHLQRGTAWHV